MLIEVKVPVLPESITEATLVAWHKKAGEAVKRDENLIDIETDKVVLELPAPDSGVITEIRKNDGATVGAQEVIAVIRALAEDGITMLMATHEMALARDLANRVLFMVNGELVEDVQPARRFFESPGSERSRQFLAHHAH